MVFFVTFQRRKNKLLLDKINQQKAFDEELAKTQQEIQEATLKHVGRELHDNVGQILSYATMQLNTVVKNVPEDLKTRSEEASSALRRGLFEVRALSKSLNNDIISNMGFDKTLSNEVQRLNKLGELQANLLVEGPKTDFENKKDEIILFRILQEFYSNTLKYSDATEITTKLIYAAKKLHIEVSDNGKGFDLQTTNKGSGLINMKKRAEMIEANFDLSSAEGKGTQLMLNYQHRAP